MARRVRLTLHYPEIKLLELRISMLESLGLQSAVAGSQALRIWILRRLGRFEVFLKTREIGFLRLVSVGELRSIFEKLVVEERVQGVVGFGDSDLGL